MTTETQITSAQTRPALSTEPAVTTEQYVLNVTPTDTRVEIIFSVKENDSAEESMIIEAMYDDRESAPDEKDRERMGDASADTRRKGKLLSELAKTSLEGVDAQLLGNGFHLVYAGVTEDDRPGRHLVRFVFDRKGNGRTADQAKWLEQFDLLATEAFWKVQNFRNPKFLEGRPVNGEHTLHLRVGECLDRFDLAGDPVMTFPRDANGRKTSETKEPIKAKYQLIFKVD